MSYDNDRVGATTATRPARDEGKKRSIWRWLLPLLVLLALLAVALFFLLGGDVDTDTQGDFDVDVPKTDIDVDAPDVDVEAPDIDVDGGSVDVKDGDAKANADN
jgi:hypothetical protein